MKPAQLVRPRPISRRLATTPVVAAPALSAWTPTDDPLFTRQGNGPSDSSSGPPGGPLPYDRSEVVT
jgi:hypothetical protein